MCSESYSVNLVNLVKISATMPET